MGQETPHARYGHLDVRGRLCISGGILDRCRGATSMSSSLDKSSESVGETVRLCPRRPYWVVGTEEDDKGHVIRWPASCDALRCPSCGPRKVTRQVRVAAVELRRHKWIRHITLTMVPPRWQAARMQIRDLFRRLRKSYSLEAIWAIEKNPKDTGFHAHVVTYGEYIPHNRLVQLWGGRHVWIDALHTKDAGYITKVYSLAGYSTKNESLEEHLDLNGGRALHKTRNFHHGWTYREMCKRLSKGLVWRLELDKATAVGYNRAKEEGRPQCVTSADIF